MKEWRRYIATEAKEEELYVQYYFFPLGSKEAAHKFNERYLKERGK